MAINNVFKDLKDQYKVINTENDKKWIADTYNKIDDIETFLEFHLVQRSCSMSGFTDDDRKELISIAHQLRKFKDLTYDHFKNKYNEEEADKYIFG